MIDYLDRTCSIVSDKTPTVGSPELSLLELGESESYVLLAEPGLGKTEVFKALAKKNGGVYITVQDFLIRDEWQQGFYYIDALDEARSHQNLNALHELRSKLYKLGVTQFALACRSAEWNNRIDTEDIRKNAQNGRVSVFALNPLTEPQAIALLGALSIEAPEAFLGQLRELGLDYAEGNPQQLMILANATKNAAGKLPTNRREAFELACSELLKEQNERHSIGMLSNETLLTITGWLSALLLLSGVSAIKRLAQNDPTTTYAIDLKELTNSQFPHSVSLEDIQTVLKRSLFKTTANGFEVIHRTVAEFLAARYIANRIKNGLSSSRVASLIQYEGTRIYQDLHGLAAWLCSLSKRMQETILSSDSKLVFDYADIGILDLNARCKLIDQLATDEDFAYTFRHRFGTRRWADLVKGEMAPFIEQWLGEYAAQDKRKSQPEGSYTLALIVLDVAIQFEDVNISPSIAERVLRKNDFPLALRDRALNALIKNAQIESKKFKVLLNDCWSKRIADDQHSLAGTLLSHLFPNEIQADVFTYIDFSSTHIDLNSYRKFWQLEVADKANGPLLLKLVTTIDGLTEKWRLEDHASKGHIKRFYAGIGKLVAKAIIEYGANQDIGTVARWLEYCHGWHSQNLLLIEDEETLASLKHWQNDNSKLMQRVLDYRFRNMERYFLATQVLLIDRDSFNYGQFFLDQAIELLSAKPEVAKHLVASAFHQVMSCPNSDKFKLEHIEGFVSRYPFFAETFDQSRTSDLQDNQWQIDRSKSVKRQVLRDKAFHQNRRKDLEYLLAHLEDISSGKNLVFLHDAAWAELSKTGKGYAAEVQHTVILDWFAQEPPLHAATHQGHKACLLSLNESSATQAWQVQKKGQRMLFVLPALFAAEALFAEDQPTFEKLDEGILGALLSINFMNSFRGNWFTWVAVNYQDLTARVFLECAKRLIATKQPHQLQELEQIFRDRSLESFSKTISQPLLKLLPTKLVAAQMDTLHWTLFGCIRYGAKAETTQLINSILKRKSITKSQKASLLLAGTMTDVDHFLQKLNQALQKNDLSKEHLDVFLGFLTDRGSDRGEFITKGMNFLAATELFKTLAPLYYVDRPAGIFSPTIAHYRKYFVDGLLKQIYEDPSDDATACLIELLKTCSVAAWNKEIKSAISTQKLVRLNSANRSITAKLVAETLANGVPTNMADLQATCLNALQELSKELPNSPTNLRNQFWNVDSRTNKPSPPHRPEPSCRDIVAQQLKPYFEPKGISLEIEKQHGDKNRSDFSLSVVTRGQNQLLLPVEVKGDWHKELFSAHTSQLEKKYATDYRSQGYGVYLVLWMGSNRGSKDRATKHPSSDTSSPEKLQLVIKNEIRIANPNSRIVAFVLDLSIDHLASSY
jgi:hypothetical protein